MEHHTDLHPVVDFGIQLGSLGICFLLGVIINIPAALIYIRNKQLRKCTDKFILYVLFVDVLSLVTLIPASFLLIVEVAASANKNCLNGANPARREERPVFLEQEEYLQGPEISFTQSDDQFSAHCVQQWIFVVQKVILIMAANLSTLGALKIAVERYLAVVAPLHYIKILKSTTIFLVSLTSFLLSVLSALIMSVVPGDFPTPFVVSTRAQNILWEESSIISSKEVKYRSLKLDSDGAVDDYLTNPIRTFHQPIHSKESLRNDPINLWWPVLTLAHATVFFVLPLIVMMFMYLRIWTEARKQHARMTHHNKSPFVVPSDTKKSEISAAQLQNIVGKFKLVQQIRRRTRMNRAARVATLSIGLLIFAFGPLYYLRIVSALKLITNPSPKPVQTSAESLSTWLKVLLPTFLACLHPLLSPFLYIYRYKKVRTELAALATKIISCLSCEHEDSINCKDAVHQINQLAEKIPSPSSDQILESQPVSNSDSDTTITIDLQCTSSTGDEMDPVCLDLSRQPEDETGRQEYSESDVESQECATHPGISSPLSNGLLQMFNCWVHSYSRRWNEHRDSVTSSASVITLLSNRSRSVPCVEPEP